MSISKIAFYHLKPDKVSGYAQVSQLLDDFLKKHKGFIRRVVKQDCKDETLYVDIIDWESIEASEKAEQAMHSEPSLRPCQEVLDKMVSFNVLRSYP